MSINDFSLPSHQLFEGPMKWYGVHDSRIAILDPEQRKAELTETWEGLFCTGEDQTPQQFRALSHCLGVLVPNELSAAAVSDSGIAPLRDIVIELDADVNPSRFFGKEGLARGRIQAERRESVRWAVIGVAQRVAVGAFVERVWSPFLGHEAGQAGVTRMQVRPLVHEEANKIAHLAPPKST